MYLSFLPMKNYLSVSSAYNVSGRNITNTKEVSSASVTVSSPTISVSNKLDGDRAVIPTTKSHDRLNRMEDAIARLGSTLERFIINSSSIKRGDGRSIRGYLTDFSVNALQSEIDGSSSDEEDYPQQGVIGAVGMVILMLSSQQKKLTVDR